MLVVATVVDIAPPELDAIAGVAGHYHVEVVQRQSERVYHCQEVFGLANELFVLLVR